MNRRTCMDARCAGGNDRRCPSAIVVARRRWSSTHRPAPLRSARAYSDIVRHASRSPATSQEPSLLPLTATLSFRWRHDRAAGKVILSLLGLAATITACPSSWIKEIVRGHEPAMTDMMVLRRAMMSFMDAHAPIPRTGIRRQPCVSESPRWGMPARGRCDSRWEKRHAVVERGGWRSPIRNAPCDAAHGAAPSQRMTSTRREWLRVRDNLPCGWHRIAAPSRHSYPVRLVTESMPSCSRYPVLVPFPDAAAVPRAVVVPSSFAQGMCDSPRDSVVLHPVLSLLRLPSMLYYHHRV